MELKQWCGEIQKNWKGNGTLKLAPTARAQQIEKNTEKNTFPLGNRAEAQKMRGGEPEPTSGTWDSNPKPPQQKLSKKNRLQGMGIEPKTFTVKKRGGPCLFKRTQKGERSKGQVLHCDESKKAK